ncbi:ATP-binding protein [Spiroplasma endosymbiont of Cantharis nigra]|uniref:ATP-binding protein n=1 Tax=Spiroplasma endosymbiont of Cantharis nigra TaxID=3066278 RepID=UPI0030D4CDEB
MINNKKVGVIISVNGDISKIGVYNFSNDVKYIWNGEILNGPRVGSFLTVNQNNIKIITTISSEEIIDDYNTLKNKEFDNRFRNNSINRIIYLKTKGVIENGKFHVTSKYVPMIGNEITITTQDEIDIIYEIEKGESTICIGESIIEGKPINIAINSFFASHIGIFGNTGSGKSNTLHKLYLELFKSKYYPKYISRKSKFFLIDFNGEYISNNLFGIKNKNKIVFNLSTKLKKAKKIYIKKDYLFDSEILSILFGATPATQMPFLKNAISTWNKKELSDPTKCSKLVVGIIKKILVTGDDAVSDAKESWIEVCKNYIDYEYLEILSNLEKLKYNSYSKGYYYGEETKPSYINNKTELDQNHENYLKLNEISEKLKCYLDKATPIEKLKFYLSFQKIYKSAWKSTNLEHINPLFNRINSSLESLEKVVEIVDDISTFYKTFNIISLVDTNQEVKKLIPMLLSKMIYDEQKNEVAGKKVNITKHLIIDEAHNILSSVNKTKNDEWQDYRLSVFEEIIKEGRKFGFYLTLSSQRPYDISPTILSQVHNYFIHRLVNEKDLMSLENTMPTLDKNAYKMIPILGQGEAVITGKSMQIPIFIKVKKEDQNRPMSDDVKLTDLWE